jgi:carbon storage regulator
MLVLGRKVGDEIVIGENIRVVVVAIRGNQVRLGFEAPREVPIRRREIECRYAPVDIDLETGLLANNPFDVREAEAGVS